jgi:YhcH/YjgK/YiaL family protein
MIYDTLNHWEQYQTVHPGLAKALEFLAGTDLAALPDGRHEIDGDNVYVNVMRYTTLADNPTPERHEQYIDVFYLLEGEELVGVCPVEELGAQVEARPQSDCWIHAGQTVRFPLGGGRFAALFPGDGHAPSIGPNGPAPARKCVVKVKV